MAEITRILLIDEGKRRLSEMELVLRVGGYDVECSSDVNTAVNRYGLFRNTDHCFDLLIADTASSGRKLLEKLYHERYIDSLILLNRRFSCSKGFCIDGGLVRLCNSKAVLTCIDSLKYNFRQAARVDRWQDGFKRLGI